MTRNHRKLNEGDKCPHFGPDCCGLMEVRLDGDCTCAVVHAPCPACEGSYLQCEDCGYDSRDPPLMSGNQQ